MRAMTASPKALTQRDLFPRGAKKEREAGVVNDRVTLRTNDGQRVVLLDGLPVHHYSTEDGTAETYAMMTLVEGGFADQNAVVVAADRRFDVGERLGQAGIVDPPLGDFAVDDEAEWR